MCQVFWWFLSKLCDSLQIISLYFLYIFFLYSMKYSNYIILLADLLKFNLFEFCSITKKLFYRIENTDVHLFTAEEKSIFSCNSRIIKSTLKLYLRNFVELNAFCAENTINIFVNLLWNDVSAGCIAYIKCWMQINAIFDKISCNLQIVRKMSFCLNFSNNIS